MTEDDIDSIFATNVKGCMLTVKSCHLERSGGRVSRDPHELDHRPPTGFPGGLTTGLRRGSAFSARPASSFAPSIDQRRHAGNVVSEGLEDLGEDYLAEMTCRSRSAASARWRRSVAALFLATDEAHAGQTSSWTAARRSPNRWPRSRRCKWPLRAGMAALGPAPPRCETACDRDRVRKAASGERLGAERELAVRLGVSRSTLRATLDSLEEAGVVHRVRGRSGGIRLPAARRARPQRPHGAARLLCAVRVPVGCPRARPAPSRPARPAAALSLDPDELARGLPSPAGRAISPTGASPLPGRPLPARPLARGLDLRPAPGRLRAPRRRSRGADRGRGRNGGRCPRARGACRRSPDLDRARPGRPTGWRSSTRATLADRVRIIARVRGRDASPLGAAVEVAAPWTRRYCARGQSHLISRDMPTHRRWDVDIEPVQPSSRAT